MNEKYEQGEVRYDYDRQAWLQWDGEAWCVTGCGHGVPSPSCYACAYEGEKLTVSQTNPK